MLYRLLADAEFFSSRISKIEGSGDLGEHIVKVVQGKTVLSTAPPPAQPSAAPTAASHEEQTTADRQDGPKQAESSEKEEARG